MYAVRRRAVRNPFKILRRRKFSAYGAVCGGKMEPDASERIAAKINRKGEIMTQIELFLLLALLFAGAGCLLSLFALLRLGALSRRQREQLDSLRHELADQLRENRGETSRSTQASVSALGQALVESQRHSSEMQSKAVSDLNEQFSLRSDALQKTVSIQLARVESRFELFTAQSSQQLERMREDNARRLEEMRRTVDEKLQKTLDARLEQSFSQVSQRLEQVYKGLGEMQALASGVGDLKKVLSNVKTRGILGEIQLGAILEQILSPEQYAANVCTRPGSTNVVEYAVRLPGDGNGTVWLPIDAKFPGDCYGELMDAYDAGDPERIAAAGKMLEIRIKGCARDIRDKYIDPPHTTDFAILFLPFEGLYAEAVRRNLVEPLAREYKINIAGPTTMAALLNSLQMGFRTLAIQRRSGEVWEVLGAVKSEFGKFRTVLEKAQERLRLAGNELDQLIGTRTRAIERRLREVQEVAPGDLLPSEATQEEPAHVIQSK